jgi:hypothetical protein
MIKSMSNSSRAGSPAACKAAIPASAIARTQLILDTAARMLLDDAVEVRSLEDSQRAL